MGFDVPGIFPPKGSMTRRPLPSSGSLGQVPPTRRYYGALRFPAALLLGLRSLHPRILPAACFFAPVPEQAAFCTGREWSPASPHRYIPDRDGRASQVPREPQCLHALLFEPGGISTRCRLSPDIAFRLPNSVGSHEKKLSRLNNTACRLPVYA